jgi:hypothetical protein
VSSLINDNREWIAKLPLGEELLDAVDAVNRLAGYYGWARLGYEGLRIAGGKLRPAWQAWRSAPKPELNADQIGVVQSIDHHVENVLNDLHQAEEQATAKASAEAKPGAPGDVTEPGTAQPPVDVRVRERAANAAERARVAEQELKAASSKLRDVFKAGGKARVVLPSLTLMALQKGGEAVARLLALTYYYLRSRALTSFWIFVRQLERDGVIEWAKLSAQEQNVIRQAFDESLALSRTGELTYGRQIYDRLSKRAQGQFAKETVDMLAAQGKALGKTRNLDVRNALRAHRYALNSRTWCERRAFDDGGAMTPSCSHGDTRGRS